MTHEKNETKIKNKLLDFFDSGALIFFITILVYYYIGQKKKIEFDLLGIPSGYISLPFMDVLDSITFLLTSYLPLVISLGLYYVMIRERYNFSKDTTCDLYEKKPSPPIKYKLNIIFFIISLLLLINSYKENSSFGYMRGLLLTIFVTFSLYQIYRFVLFLLSKCTGENQSYTLNRETTYFNFFWIMIIVVLFHFVITGMVYLESLTPYETSISEPVKELINDKNGNLKHTKYSFKMLIKENNNYAVWRNATITVPLKDENKRIDIKFSEVLEYDGINNVKISQIKLSQKINFFSNAPKNRLGFNNLKDIETQFALFNQR